MEKLTFALVGCGRIATKHADAVSTGLPNARLGAVCDIVPERAKAIGEKYGVPYYSSYDEMLERHPEIDVLNVLTPSGDHPAHVIALSRFKKHIVVEKPMALAFADAEAMVEACDRNGVRLFVVKQNRYNLPVKKLKEAVVSGRFGKLVLGTVRVRWCRPQSYYDQAPWRGTWKNDGGVLMNQASHHVDLLTWMMGQVESVFAYGATQLANIETEDTAIAVLKFTNGALGVIEATTATRPKDLEGSISILGERGSVEVGGFSVNQMKTWNFVDSTGEDDAQTATLQEQPPNVYGFGHVAYLADVIETIRTGRLCTVDGMEGMKSLYILNAIYESMETRSEVRVNFSPRRLKLGH